MSIEKDFHGLRAVVPLPPIAPVSVGVREVRRVCAVRTSTTGATAERAVFYKLCHACRMVAILGCGCGAVETCPLKAQVPVVSSEPNGVAAAAVRRLANGTPHTTRLALVQQLSPPPTM